ncbi:MAG: glycerophosphodiester phosphodiesterase family protein [Pseudomonadota bacterium]
MTRIVLRALVSAGVAGFLAGCGSEPETDAPNAGPSQSVNLEITELAEELPIEWPTLDGEPPLVIAHRGASGYLPEHTIEAYQRALEMGADVIEPDLVVSKDGVLIARHDRYLSTTTNVSDVPEFADRKKPDSNPNGDGRVDWWVEDFTLDELKTLKARQPRPTRGTEFDDRFDIPTFEEVLVLASSYAQENGRPVAIYPETKYPGFFASIDNGFQTPLLSALDGFSEGFVYVQSFELDILKQLREESMAKLVYLTDNADAVSPDGLQELAGFVDGIGVYKQLVMDGAGCPTGVIEEAHQRGLFVHAWTFRDDAPVRFAATDDGNTCAEGSTPMVELNAAFEAGVDGVFTDFPDTAVAARDAFKN